ncbi:MAG: zf-HC2 domain-containing protein [Candidatus Aminicenantes bacterium]|nr:zf-HC2 domain-containing protein [Candidatus Aminicenantes bacterium]
MNCRKAERWLLASFDRDLPAADRDILEGHLNACSACRKKAEEYVMIRGRLAGDRTPEPLPHFWERLESRLIESRSSAPGAALVRLWTRAIPVSLSLLAGFLVATLFFLPPVRPGDSTGAETAGLSGSQTLLLTDGNPIAEAAPIFEESRRDVRNLQVLFAAVELPAGKR